jgi:tRNA threonylcarbamoyladenosine biosynthesis protein TsaE
MTLSLASLTYQQLTSFSQCFATIIEPGMVVCLHGPLGVGKTTFVQMLGKALGINEPSISPTFTLMKMYPLKQATFVHIDAYRLNKLQRHGDVLDALQTDTIALIEWGENLDLEGVKVIDVTFTYQSEFLRQLIIDIEDENKYQVLKECIDAYFSA